MLSCTQADLRAFASDNPDVRAVHIKTDGAGCYSGKCTALALPLLTDWTGIRVLTHSLGEAGQNKSELDGHFVVAGPKVSAEVASGGGDAATASEVAERLRGGVASGIANFDESGDHHFEGRAEETEIPCVESAWYPAHGVP